MVWLQNWEEKDGLLEPKLGDAPRPSPALTCFLDSEPNYEWKPPKFHSIFIHMIEFYSNFYSNQGKLQTIGAESSPTSNLTWFQSTEILTIQSFT